MLRDYQRLALNQISAALVAGERRIYATLPTGTGKAVIAGALAVEQRQSGRVLIVAHRTVIVRQLADHMKRWCGARNVGIVMGSEDTAAAPVIAGSIQTLAGERLNCVLTHGRFALAIIDEAHHAVVGNSYDGLLTALTAHSPEIASVGFTATPRPYSAPPAPLFTTCVFARGIDERIAAGYLAPLRQTRVRVPLDLAEAVCGRNSETGEVDYRPLALAAEARRPEVIAALVDGTISEIGERLGARALAAMRRGAAT